MFGQGFWRDRNGVLGQEAEEKLAILGGGEFLDGEEGSVHARQEASGIGNQRGDSVGESLISEARPRKVRVSLVQIELETANELVEETGFEFKEKDAETEVEGRRGGI